MSAFPISGLRSVELSVSDPARAAKFYTDVWGLTLAGQRDGIIWLRATGTDAYVLRLTKGETAAVLVTFAAAPDTELGALRDRIIAAGGTAEGDIGAVDDIGGGTGFAVRDPAGRLYRVVQGTADAAPLDGDSQPDRLAHVNINTTDIDRDIAFFERGLGFRLTDRSAKMGFLRTNADHHAVVLAMAPVDTLNHIAFNHPSWEDVMRASGRMCDAGFPIGWGPGRHGPGDNVFAYFVDPDGIVIEHTAEVLEVDDSYRVGTPADWVWPKGRTDQWGIAPPKRDDCAKAQLAIPFV
ncbi:MAG: glyoxalase [Maritimibacter sp.]|nr:glyoxalase [Maritimibacter sp.]